MKILLDECVDERLADDFAGHDPATPQPVCMPWMLKQAAPTGLAASVEGSLFRATADMAPFPFERPGTSCYSRKRHEGGSANRAQKGDDYPNFVTSLSKTQVDRLGDRLRKGKVEEDDFRLLDAYRRSFSEAYEEVVAIIRGTTQLDPTGRPAKSTTSITEKLRR